MGHANPDGLANILLESASITISLVSVPIRPLLSGQHALAGLREVVPQALEYVKESLIYRFWKRTQRILKAYREGAVFGDEAYKQRMYKSHWRVQVHQERGESIK